MKTQRNDSRPGSHEQRYAPWRDDSYRANAKLADPTACPDCGAAFHKGRWTWRAAPADAHVARCPACQRISDDLPAGYVTLKGPYARAHKEELLAAVRSHEAREKALHPMQRIMNIADAADGILITTTDGRLARGIAEALRRAFKGHVRLRYAHEENLVRAVWDGPNQTVEA